MSNILAKRIEELESKILKKDDESVKAIFIKVVDARKEAALVDEQEKQSVNGWEMNGLKVFRAAGESDKELEQRAIKEAMPLLNHPLARPVFMEITEDDENDAEKDK